MQTIGSLRPAVMMVAAVLVALGAVVAAQDAPADEAPCGSCFGAEDDSKGFRCCNTCSEVRAAYAAKQWAWPGMRRTWCSRRSFARPLRVQRRARLLRGTRGA